MGRISAIIDPYLMLDKMKKHHSYKKQDFDSEFEKSLLDREEMIHDFRDKYCDFSEVVELILKFHVKFKQIEDSGHKSSIHFDCDPNVRGFVDELEYKIKEMAHMMNKMNLKSVHESYEDFIDVCFKYMEVKKLVIDEKVRHLVKEQLERETAIKATLQENADRGKKKQTTLTMI